MVYRKQTIEFDAEIRKGGNALCINIPQHIVKKHNLHTGTPVSTTLEFTYMKISKLTAEELSEAISTYFKEIPELRKFSDYQVATFILMKGFLAHGGRMPKGEITDTYKKIDKIFEKNKDKISRKEFTLRI